MIAYIVTDKAVTGPLGEESDGENDAHTTTISGGLEKRGIRASLGDVSFDAEGLSDLSVCEVH